MNKALIKKFVKERDAVITLYDVEKFKEFYRKWYKKGFYDIPVQLLPPDNLIEVSLRKMAYHSNGVSIEEKQKAKEWLELRGLTTDI
jgi:hypothetical protein